MDNHTLKISMLATPIVLIACGSFLSAPASAKSPFERTCSNRTIRGQYGGSVEGIFLAGPGITLPVRGVGITNYDGEGTLNEYGGYLVINGVPPGVPGATDSGTYQVNPDCTGTAHIVLDPSSNFFINLAFVVVGDGKEIYSVLTGPYAGPVILSSFVSKKIL